MPTPREDASDDLSGWIADRLTSARVDADRIARELLRDGRISAEEVAALGTAVERAIERGRTLIGDALREPRRILAGLRQAASSTRTAADGDVGTPEGTPDATRAGRPDDAAARIARLEARVAALEALVAGGATHARGGDGG